MKKYLAGIFIMTIVASTAWADCNPIICMGQGGVCVSGVCVPKGTTLLPTPSPAPAPTGQPTVTPATPEETMNFIKLVLDKFCVPGSACVVIVPPCTVTTPTK